MIEIKPDFELTGANIYLTKEVIATIASKAALEIEGISFPEKGKNDKKGYSKFVKIEGLDDELQITLFVNVKNPKNLLETSKNIQKKVRSEIQNMTGIIVGKVNITTLGIA
ncbi:MAG: Asp23/Gls24 family envelope stress response protein [Defluviitaleaceae bacterium]|nr:Asp23/Gls24 family envelope stress response protein [Defluviitaleaceae bacterium]